MVVTNGNGFIYVGIQYRLGAFGFLSSDDVHNNGVANAGLYDMHFALQWVQDQIYKVGGDPRRVTIAGESAGGGGVMHMAMAYGGTDGTKLFTNAIVASPYLPKQWRYNDPKPTTAYNNFAEAAGCSGQANVFACLQGGRYPDPAKRQRPCSPICSVRRIRFCTSHGWRSCTEPAICSALFRKSKWTKDVIGSKYPN